MNYEHANTLPVQTLVFRDTMEATQQLLNE